jgi:c-di-GMP-binding flagellar brake protein YcgR
MAKPLFEVNTRAEVQVDEDYRREVLFGKIVAVSKDNVSVAASDANGQPVGLLRGTRVTLSIPYLTSHYTFETTVLETRKKPDPVLVLERPRDEAAATRRAHVRIDMVIGRVRMSVNWLGKAKQCLSTIVNLSAGGALVRTDDVVPIDARLHLVFALPDGRASIAADGIALRCSERPGRKDLTSFRTALRFVRIDPLDQERITQFILTREKEMRVRGVV